MKKKFLSLLLLGGLTLTAGAQYQVANSGFEEWETVSYNSNSGEEPTYWNSFLDGTGSKKSYAGYDQVDKVEESRTGSAGKYSAKITARPVKFIGVTIALAQGNLTTGCVNMGSTTASDANGNYNYTNIDDGKCQAFTGRPDAMRVWVKYTSSQETYQAKANAILHTAGYYQDPIGNTITATLVAKAEKTDIDNTGSWQDLTLPFTYSSDSQRPAYALISFATSNTAGQGGETDAMLIDDLEFLYYSQLSDLTYKGTTVTGFNKDTYNYTVDGFYYEGCLEATKNCAGGTVELGTYDALNKSISVVVKGDNISEDASNYHTYTVTFTEDAPVLVSSTDYTDNLVVSINGSASEPQETTINVKEYSNGTYTLSLDNFVLVNGDEVMPIGKIELLYISAENSNGLVSFSTNQTIQIQPGSAEEVPEDMWMGPGLGIVPIDMSAKIYGDKLYCEIDIDMMESLGQIINVVFGKPIVAQTQSAALTETGEAHVVLNRQFLEGWNTICLPFAATPEAVAGTGAVAQAFDGADSNGLDFVVAETMEANTPYLIYVPANTAEQTFIANVTLEEAAPASVTYGDYTFKGNYEANMPMADLYGVADKDGVQKIMKGSATAKLQGTRAYFMYSGQSNVNGMRINLEGQGDVTSIDGVQVLSGSCDVYNLQGIRVRTAATSLEGLTPGIYVVNGKKVMVK